MLGFEAFGTEEMPDSGFVGSSVAELKFREELAEFWQ